MRELKTNVQGVFRLHKDGCSGKKCRCPEKYRAKVFDSTRKKQVTKVHRDRLEARNWRNDTLRSLDKGDRVGYSGVRLDDCLKAFLEAAYDGRALNKKGRRYKPSAIADVDDSIRVHVVPWVGHKRLGDIRRKDVQETVDRMTAKGLSGSRVRSVVNSLRALYAYAVDRELADSSPVTTIRLPAMNETRRDHVVTPEDFGAAIAVQPRRARLAYSLAAFATARRAEIAHLRWAHVGWDTATLRFADEWEYRKYEASDRVVPIIPKLKALLREEWFAQGRPDDGYVIQARGRGQRIAVLNYLVREAKATWNDRQMAPIGLHEARHTAASYLRAAGLDLKIISQLMGHASITLTQDRYTHLMPGELEGAGSLLASYLEGARDA